MKREILRGFLQRTETKNRFFRERKLEGEKRREKILEKVSLGGALR